MPVQAGGSLVANTTGYFDNVQISVDNGAINETTMTNGVSTSYVQQPLTGMTVTQDAGLPAVTSDTLTFNRRWLIAYNTPITGVRTVTVLVTATTQALKPQVTFQMRWCGREGSDDFVGTCEEGARRRHSDSRLSNSSSRCRSF